jgi:hypothetical protein
MNRLPMRKDDNDGGKQLSYSSAFNICRNESKRASDTQKAEAVSIVQEIWRECIASRVAPNYAVCLNYVRAMVLLADDKAKVLEECLREDAMRKHLESNFASSARKVLEEAMGESNKD